jgi:uncharacterized protein (TIGR03663 family)
MSVSLDDDGKGRLLLDRVLDLGVRINAERLLYIVLIVIAILTRFHDLESRVMSHDESLHTYYSWRYLKYQDYSHNPMMHGPFQFHLVALSYFIFGDSDASSRIPAALAGVISIALLYFFRKWLGRWGALFAIALMVASPYMLYYHRYVRNEALVVLLAILMIWAIFSYYQTREMRWLVLFSVSLSLHYATKETSFIYALQLMLFLAGYLAWELWQRFSDQRKHRMTFLSGLCVSICGVTIAGIAFLLGRPEVPLDSGSTLEALAPAAASLASSAGRFAPLFVFGLLVTCAGLALICIPLARVFGRSLSTEFPTLDLLVITLTVTLPQLAGIPARILGWDQLPANTSAFSHQTGILVISLFALSAAIGLLWNWRKWLVAMGAFWGPFILLYTSLFSQKYGFDSGLVRSLEYWIDQHKVERGGQPWFYYLAIQIPIYEFLPAIGTILAGWLGLNQVKRYLSQKRNGQEDPGLSRQNPLQKPERLPYSTLLVIFLGYWTVTSLVGYSFAGEKMPWLTVHIALPMILLAGWVLGKAAQASDWTVLQSGRGWLLVGLILVSLFSLLRLLGGLAGIYPPFQGSELYALRDTSAFLASLAVLIAAWVAIYFVSRDIDLRILPQLGGWLMIAILYALTIRASFRASYQTYDQATEFLVYAHSATGVKTVLSQVEEFSRRTTDGLAVQVAYDNDVAWPYTWYLRNYTQKRYFGESPSRELIESPLIIVGNDNWQKVEPFVRQRYFSFQYIRMWWPNQDYFKLGWKNIEYEFLADQGSGPEAASRSMSFFDYIARVAKHLRPFLLERERRQALWEIWLNRDYSRYAKVTGKEISLEKWSPADEMRLYLRKDVASLVWDSGTIAAAAPEFTFVDPYAEKMIAINASAVIGQQGSAPGQFQTPRAIAVAPDGTIYIADAGNHRVQRLSAEGELLAEWGEYANIPEGEPPPGSFNDPWGHGSPWGVGIAPDGTVYVADTWGHRIQYFSPEGKFLGMFGRQGQTLQGDLFWGPRAVAVDANGRVFVADTGNKRIAIFDAKGSYLGEFGGPEYGLGRLDEPVGIAIDGSGDVYVADTWNQRVVVYGEVSEGIFQMVNEWEIQGWYGTALDNKPYLAISPNAMLCVSDPEGFRILCFDTDGEFLLGWGDYGIGPNQFGLPVGVAFGPDGSLWVSDGRNHRIMIFQLESP